MQEGESHPAANSGGCQGVISLIFENKSAPSWGLGENLGTQGVRYDCMPKALSWIPRY